MLKVSYRNFIIPFFAIAFLFTSAVLNGCESQQSKERRLSKEKAEEIKNRKEYFEQFYRRDAILLSLKYKVNEEKVFNLLVEENDIMYKDVESLEDFLFGKGLKKRIENYAVKYNMPTDIIASILIDYDTMQNEY